MGSFYILYLVKVSGSIYVLHAHKEQGRQGIGLTWILQNRKQQRRQRGQQRHTTALWRPCLPKNGRGGPEESLAEVPWTFFISPISNDTQFLLFEE